MKKFLVVFLSLLLIFALTACNMETNNTDSNIGDISQDTNTNGVVTGENTSDSVNGNLPSGSAQANNTNKTTINQATQNKSTQSTTQMSSKSVATNKTTINQATQNKSTQSTTQTSFKSTVTNNTTNSGNVDNGVLEKATSEKMNVPENMKLLGTNNAKEENNSKNIKATVTLYQLDGDVVNWTTENDFIYVITSGNNRLVVINSKTMMAVGNVPLAGKPAEMNFVGDKIYISLPDLCRIDIFSKSNFAKISSLYFDHEVSSFCVDGNYIYYSEHDQHCAVYKKNTTTNELTKILPDIGFSFSQPKLYLNKQDNILYIGETGSSGCSLFYYDATTLQLKSLFRKNNYGMVNHTRDIFHVGNEIFWANYRFSDTDAKQIVGRYGEANYGSVNFVSKEVVSTFEGLFLTDTYECIIDYLDDDFRFEYVLVSESYNIFFRKRVVDGNIILGVNFTMQ